MMNGVHVGGGNRKVYFDVMRIIAAFLVIFNHLGGYALYQHSSGFKEWIYLFITMVTRINVPLFLMISGALLLGKEETYRTLFGKRIKRIVLVIIIFEFGMTVLSALFSWYHTGSFSIHLPDFFLGVMAGNLPDTGQYWYLYAYLDMLFMLPFLRKIIRTISVRDVCLLFILHFVMSSLLPMVNTVLSAFGMRSIAISGYFSIPLAVTKAFFYPILGYYLEYFIDVEKLKARMLWLLAGGALMGICLSSVFTFYQGITRGMFTQDYVQLFDYMSTIFAFILIKYVIVVKFPRLGSGRVGILISMMGSLTFGIYLLDPYFRKILYSRFDKLLEPLFPTLIVSVCWCIFSMILGGICTYCLKKLPVFRNIL